MGMMMDDDRVSQLEEEIRVMREAFEDYVHSSRELEDGLDKELTDMHGRLATSSAANQSLEEKLVKMEPLLRNLESSLEVTKKKLKEESRLRRQAEVAQTLVEQKFRESEKRMDSLQQQNKTIKEECDALHEELEFKCKELDKLRESTLEKMGQRNNRGSATTTHHRRDEKTENNPGAFASANNESTTASKSSRTKMSASAMEDSYAEVLDELEAVTEQLIHTQQKLWKTEDTLRTTEARVRKLESSPKEEDSDEIRDSSLENSDEHVSKSNENNKLEQELSMLRSDLRIAHEELKAAEEQAEEYQIQLEMYENMQNSSESSSHTTAIRTLQEQVRDLKRRTDDEISTHRTTIDNLREDIAQLQEEAQNAQETIENLQDEINNLQDTAANAQDQVAEYEELLNETKDENAHFVEEIACLRLLLQDRDKAEKGQGEQPGLSSKGDDKSVSSSFDASLNPIQERVGFSNSQSNSGSDTISSQSRAEIEKKIKSEIEGSIRFEIEEATRKKIENEIKESVLKEATKEREREIGVLREKFRKLFKENAFLQERVNELEGDSPLALIRREEAARLRDEINRLKEALATNENSWRAKVNEAVTNTESNLNEQLREMSRNNASLKDRTEDLEKALSRAKQETAMSSRQRSAAEDDLRVARDEILKLRKRIGILNTDLEHSNRTIERLDADSERMMERYSEVKAELEWAKQLIEDQGIDEDTVNRESHVQLKQKVHALTEALDKVQQDYGDLEREFENNRRAFYDMQEEMSRKSDDEIVYLTKRIAELERTLENAEVDQSDISVKLRQAKEECEEALKIGEQRGKEIAARELKAHHVSERRMVMDKFDALVEEKGRLENQLKERDEKVSSVVRDLEEAKSALAPLEQQLNNYSTELSHIKTENRNLRNELERARNSHAVLDKFFGDPDEIRTSYRKDPDPSSMDESEGFEVVRDPPSSRSLLLSDPSVAESKSDGNAGALHAKLLDMTIENELLREKVLNMSSSSDSDASKETKASKASKRSNDSENERLKEQINALQVCLEDVEHQGEELEALEEKLEDLTSKLKSKETELEKTVEELGNSREENNTLKSELLDLKDTILGARKKYAQVAAELEETKLRNKEIEKEVKIRGRESIDEIKLIVASERGGEFDDLRIELRKLSEEKARLQHQLDDSKIALSVSQYAQERNKEELRNSEGKLEKSMEEVYKLKSELDGAEKSMRDMQNDFSDVIKELKTVRARWGKDKSLSEDIKALTKENSDLQQLVTELERAYSKSQKDLDEKTQKVTSLERSLVSTQEETRLLTKEISHLSTAFETAKTEYDQVVDELEAVNELFEEARQEAERSGREAAIDEIRAEMTLAREKERKMMKEQLKKVFEENASLQRKVDNVEVRLTEAKQSQLHENETVVIHKEVQMLKDALQAASTEVKRLKEKEMNLNIVLSDTRMELKLARQELDMASKSFDDSRREFERTARASAAEEFRSSGESPETQRMRRTLDNLRDEMDRVKHSSLPSDFTSMQKAEVLKMKVELLDMSISIEKLMKENSILEEELERTKNAMSDERKKGEKQGKIEAIREVRQEMKVERERDMEELKNGFNELVQENNKLEQQVREAQISTAATKDSHAQSQKELARLEEELKSSKAEARRLQDEVRVLTTELQSAKDDHEKSMADAREQLKTERDAKVKALSNQLSALSIENTSLQQKTRTAGMALTATHSSEMEALHTSLQRSQDKIAHLTNELSKVNMELEGVKEQNEKNYMARQDLEDKLKRTQHAVSAANDSMLGADNDVEELISQLCSSKYEASELRSKVMKLSRDLEERTKELDNLKQRFDEACHEAENRGRQSAGRAYRENNELAEANELKILREQLQKLTEEKAALHQQVDDARIYLSLSKYNKDREEESTIRTDDLQQLTSKLLKAKEEHSSTLDALDKINKILDSIEKVHSVFGGIGVDEAKNLCTQCLIHGRFLDNTLKLADHTLGSARTIEDQLRGQYTIVGQSLATTSSKTEEITSKISNLSEILEKSRKDHSAVLAELNALKERAETPYSEGDKVLLTKQIKTFSNENLMLEKKVRETEAELETARKAQRKHRVEVELLEMKYQEAKKEAAKFKSEVVQLQNSLGNAHQDHVSLRRQLEGLNTRVAQMCAEAEARGRAEATKQLQHGLNNLEHQERNELMAQFKVFYEENLSLQKKLDDTEAALTGSQVENENNQKKLKKLEELEATNRRLQLELESLTQASRLANEDNEKKLKKLEELEAINRRLSRELASLTQALSEARGKRGNVVGELSEIKRRLANVRREGSAARDSGTKGEESDMVSVSERDAELHLLQDQFKKLSSQSEILGQKLVEAESEISSIRKKQEKNENESQDRVKKAKDLEGAIVRAIDDRKIRDDEISELSVLIENRISMAEQSVDRLEGEITAAKDKLHVAEPSLLKMSQTRSTRPDWDARDEVKRPETLSAESEIQASERQDIPESTEDDRFQPSKRARSRSPQPKADCTALTSRALEAISKGRSKFQRRFDAKFKKDNRALGARNSPFSARLAQRLPEPEESRAQTMDSRGDSTITERE